MKQVNTLIILPGWGGSAKTWEGFVSFLEKHIPDTTVHVIELPCFGEEPCPSHVWGVAEYADFVKHKIAHIKKGRVFLFGHSFGGQVAAYLVAKDQNICEQLFLSGAAIYRPKHTLKRVFFGGLAKIGKILFLVPFLKKYGNIARRLLYKTAHSPDYLKVSGIQQEIFKKVIREDISQDLLNIMVHTTIIWGEKDTYTPLKFGKQIAENIPNATLHIIPNGTHGLHLHHKKAVADIIDTVISA